MIDLDTNEDWLALLRTIRTYPHDTLPRLVAADWLEENGHPERAEFIRLDCEPGGIGYADAHRLWHRYNAERWCGDLYAAGLVTVSPAVWDPAVWDHAYQDRAGRAAIRNGFVEEVRCPLGWWVGGQCEHCTGGTLPRYLPGESGRDACQWCGGTGRTTGHGPEVVARHPVSVVRVVDAVPVAQSRNRMAYFGWFNSARGNPLGEPMAELPPYVLLRLAEWDNSWHHDIRDDAAKYYPTAALAHAALSRALLDPLREAAGLPALPVEVIA